MGTAVRYLHKKNSKPNQKIQTKTKNPNQNRKPHQTKGGCHLKEEGIILENFLLFSFVLFSPDVSYTWVLVGSGYQILYIPQGSFLLPSSSKYLIHARSWCIGNKENISFMSDCTARGPQILPRNHSPLNTAAGQGWAGKDQQLLMLECDLPSPLTLLSMLCPDFNATVESDPTQEGNLQLSSLRSCGAGLCGIS